MEQPRAATVGRMNAALQTSLARESGAPHPRLLVRDTAPPEAECPVCGATLAISTQGAVWTVRSPGDVADRLILQLGSLEREELIVLLINAKNVVVGEVAVYRGNVSAAVVRTSELFTEAVRQCVPRVLLAHNHPSGDPTPSADDLTLTASAIAAGRLLDIEVLDHVIVAGGTYRSLRDLTLAFERRA
jgi:DNA repair protein RadC